MKVPVTLSRNADGSFTRTTEASQSGSAERFTLAVVTSPSALADSLTRLAKDVADDARVIAAWRRAGAVTFENLPIPSSGRVTLGHNLGRAVRWQVVEWSGNGVTVTPVLVCDRLDASGSLTTPNVLCLRSYAAGMASIEVW